MTEASESETGARVGGTIVACFVAFIVFTVVAILIGGLISLFYTFLTVIRPAIIDFFAAIIGGYAGVVAARLSCDSILKAYSKRVVFFVFAAIAVGGAYFELIVEPWGWARIGPLAQLTTIAIASWTLFWKGIEL